MFIQLWGWFLEDVLLVRGMDPASQLRARQLEIQGGAMASTIRRGIAGVVHAARVAARE